MAKQPTAAPSTWGAERGKIDNNWDALFEKLGVVDFSHAGAVITLTAADTKYTIINDGAGLPTNKLFVPSGHGDLVDTTTGHLDFSSLKLGDFVVFRTAMQFNASGANRDITITLELGTGGSAYELHIEHESYKSSGNFPLGVVGFVYMGDTNTLNNPGIFKAMSDGTGDTLTNFGLAALTFVR